MNRPNILTTDAVTETPPVVQYARLCIEFADAIALECKGDRQVKQHVETIKAEAHAILRRVSR